MTSRVSRFFFIATTFFNSNFASIDDPFYIQIRSRLFSTTYCFDLFINSLHSAYKFSILMMNRITKKYIVLYFSFKPLINFIVSSNFCCASCCSCSTLFRPYGRQHEEEFPIKKNIWQTNSYKYNRSIVMIYKQ